MLLEKMHPCFAAFPPAPLNNHPGPRARWKKAKKKQNSRPILNGGRRSKDENNIRYRRLFCLISHIIACSRNWITMTCEICELTNEQICMLWNEKFPMYFYTIKSFNICYSYSVILHKPERCRFSDFIKFSNVSVKITGATNIFYILLTWRIVLKYC